MTNNDVAAAVSAVLAVDDAIQAWSADTLQSDAVDRARRELRAMVVRLGDLAHRGVKDPATIVAPIVDRLLEARRAARAAQDYATSDLLRDVLVEAGVIVNDTAEGVSWSYEALDDEGTGAPTSR